MEGLWGPHVGTVAEDELEAGPGRGTFEAMLWAGLAPGDLGTPRVQGQDWASIESRMHLPPGFHEKNGMWGSEGNASVAWGCL